MMMLGFGSMLIYNTMAVSGMLLLGKADLYRHFRSQAVLPLVFRAPGHLMEDKTKPSQSPGWVCSHCGAGLRSDWIHCPNCGAPVTQKA